MMEKGISSITSCLDSFLSNEVKSEIDYYVMKSKNKQFLTFNSSEQIDGVLGDLVNDFTSLLSTEQSETIRLYTGISYKEINAVARNNWSYEVNGRKTSEIENYYRNLGEEMSRVISKFPSLGYDIKVYRGAFLNQFWEYGIRSLDDLKAMEGQFFYDAGFTSTSLCRDKSLLDVSAFLNGNRNIEMEYLVPAECRDGILLLGDSSSYHQDENEYLLNCDSLARITEVKIDKEKNKAFMRAVVIPKSLWDPIAYNNNLNEEKVM